MPQLRSETRVPEGYGTVTPWLISPDSAALIRFLEAAFGAEEIPGSRVHNPNGSIAHVEVKIGSSIVMHVQQTLVDALRTRARHG